jgi:GT2 family glycosyltransferase
MHVTVCVCTRNRGDSVVTTLRSILACNYADFDVVVVDQSLADDTETAVREIEAAAGRITYVRSASRGSSAAHNIAIAYASGPLLAFTDDDCAVAVDWLTRLVDYFRTYPEAGLICGPVYPAPHDQTAGFIPTAEFPRLKTIVSPWTNWRERGIGANMALRRKTLEEVGPFDEALGTGGPLYASLDRDMTYRVLRAGYTVLDVPDAAVTHYGFRTWQEGRLMMRRVGIGIGATYMKHLLLGDLAVLPTLLIVWVRCIHWRRALLLRPHSGIACFLYYALGMALSLRYPKDPRTRTYKLPSQSWEKPQVRNLGRLPACRMQHDSNGPSIRDCIG